MPELIGGLNDLGMGLIGGTANAWMEGRQNKQSRKWSEKMYDRQRADALSDWQMQADYNSPANQRQRLIDAKLNPNLVYGHGADAQMGSPVRSSSAPGYSPQRREVGRMDGSLSLDQYFNYQAKQAQIDNMHAQNDVLKQEGLLKAFNLSRGQSFMDYDLQFKEASIWKTRNEAELSSQKWEIGNEELEIIRATKPQTIQKAVEVLMNMRAERARTDNEAERIRHASHVLMQSERLAEFEIQMRESNIMPGTPAWFRAFQLLWRKLAE